jgi:hypothetical protein
MTILQRAILAFLGVGLLLFTLELIRRRRLREEYSLMWLLTGVVLLLFVVFPEALYRISEALHLYHLTTMLMVVFLFLLLIVLHYSTVISQISERETELAQQVAMLTWQVEKLSEGREGGERDSAVDDQADVILEREAE